MSNVEFAHDVSAHGHSGGSGTAHAKRLGFIEAMVLALVAVATAWSGYQASRWDGISTRAYAQSGQYATRSQAKSTLAGQDRLYDIVTFNGWVAAKMAGHTDLAAFYERRFRPEYEVAFKAWIAKDPVHSRSVPPGPIFMPQYKNANANDATRLENLSEQRFDYGVHAREQSEDYVRVTVFLATALFLTALSQRFEFAGPRAAIVAVAAILLIISLFWIIRLPRA